MIHRLISEHDSVQRRKRDKIRWLDDLHLRFRRRCWKVVNLVARTRQVSNRGCVAETWSPSEVKFEKASRSI